MDQDFDINAHLAQIHEDHLQIAVAMQYLHDHLESGSPRENVAAHLDKLAELCRDHFDREMAVFAARCPEAAAGFAAMHARLVTDMERLLRLFHARTDIAGALRRFSAALLAVIRDEHRVLKDNAGQR